MSYTVYIHLEGDAGNPYIFKYDILLCSWLIQAPDGNVYRLRSVPNSICRAIRFYLLQKFDIRVPRLQSQDNGTTFDIVVESTEFRIPPTPSEFITLMPSSPCNPRTLNSPSSPCNPLVNWPSTLADSPARPRKRYLTMMPTSNFNEVASMLSIKDLKYMRIVSLRVLSKLLDTNLSRRKAVRMWKGHIQALIRYGIAIAEEIVSRGGSDTSMIKFQEILVPGRYYKPIWVYWPKLQASHRAYLVLRGMRDAAVAALFSTLDLNNMGGLSHILMEKVGVASSRDLTACDICSLDLSDPFEGYYSDIYSLNGKEDFVYPSDI